MQFDKFIHSFCLKIQAVGWIGISWCALTATSAGHGEIAIPETMAQSMVDAGWRRTVDGWEHISTWSFRPRVTRTRTFHPLQLAFLQCGLSMAILLIASHENIKTQSHGEEF